MNLAVGLGQCWCKCCIGGVAGEVVFDGVGGGYGSDASNYVLLLLRLLLLLLLKYY